MKENWGSEKIVTRKTIYIAPGLPGFIAERGFSLVAIYRNAIEEARKLKPEIP